MYGERMIAKTLGFRKDQLEALERIAAAKREHMGGPWYYRRITWSELVREAVGEFVTRNDPELQPKAKGKPKARKVRR